MDESQKKDEPERLIDFGQSFFFHFSLLREPVHVFLFLQSLKKNEKAEILPASKKEATAVKNAEKPSTSGAPEKVVTEIYIFLFLIFLNLCPKVGRIN